MPERHAENLNRDEDQKPGAPPSSATAPRGSEASSRSPKTMTDPQSGARHTEAPAPNRSKADDTPDR